METEAKPFGLSQEAIKLLLDNTLKPEEIAGDAPLQLKRVHELIHWFRRYANGNANPKWLEAHAFELAYYIATTAGNRFIDLDAIEKAAWLKGVQISQEEKEVLQRHEIIPKQS